MKHERNEEFVPFGFSFGVTRNEEDILRILCLPLGVATLQGEDEPKQNEIGFILPQTVHDTMNS